MSIKSLYQIQCSGPCEQYLCKLHEDWTKDPELGDIFDTWGEAEKAAANARWWDGSQGQLAPCTCNAPNPDCTNPRCHGDDCRTVKPWLVPICLDCRKDMK